MGSFVQTAMGKLRPAAQRGKELISKGPFRARSTLQEGGLPLWGTLSGGDGGKRPKFASRGSAEGAFRCGSCGWGVGGLGCPASWCVDRCWDLRMGGNGTGILHLHLPGYAHISAYTYPRHGQVLNAGLSRVSSKRRPSLEPQALRDSRPFPSHRPDSRAGPPRRPLPAFARLAEKDSCLKKVPPAPTAPRLHSPPGPSTRKSA